MWDRKCLWGWGGAGEECELRVETAAGCGEEYVAGDVEHLEGEFERWRGGRGCGELAGDVCAVEYEWIECSKSMLYLLSIGMVV